MLCQGRGELKERATQKERFKEDMRLANEPYKTFVKMHSAALDINEQNKH